MNTIERIQASTKLLDKSLDIITIFCLLSSVAFAFFNVVVRALFDTGYLIIDELCRYTIVYCTFLYLGPLIVKDEHIKMDLMNTILRGKWNHLHSILVNSIVLFSILVILWSSVNWVNDLFQMKILTSSGLMLMVVPTLAVPLGMLLGSMYAIKQIIIDVYKLKYSYKDLGNILHHETIL